MADEQPQKQRSQLSANISRLFWPIFLIISMALLILTKLAFVFVILALLPSISAYFIDQTRNKATFKTVLACNIATMLHPFADILRFGWRHSQLQFSQAIGNPSVWLYIYIGAAAGWGLFYVFRFVANYGVTYFHEYQLYFIQKQQKWLINEWGKEVIGDTEDE